MPNTKAVCRTCKHAQFDDEKHGTCSLHSINPDILIIGESDVCDDWKELTRQCRFIGVCEKFTPEPHPTLDPIVEAVVNAAREVVINMKDGINIGVYRHCSNGTLLDTNDWHRLNEAVAAYDKSTKDAAT